MFAVACFTGWRVKSELLTRQWAHVDVQSGWLRLEPGETKNLEGRQFPITSALRVVLERQRERTLAVEKAKDGRAQDGEHLPALSDRGRGDAEGSGRQAQVLASPAVPLNRATNTRHAGPSTGRVSRAQRARWGRAARAKSLPAGEKKM